MKPAYWWVLAAAVAVAVGLVKVSGGVHATFGKPQYQPAADDDLARLTAPDGYHYLCQPHQHHAGYTWTRHRYPVHVGGEVTNAIHKGFSSMRVPDLPWAQEIIAPPSEVMW